MKTIKDQLIEKQKELIDFLIGTLFNDPLEEREQHKYKLICMEIDVLESQTNQSEISVMPTDEEIEKQFPLDRETILKDNYSSDLFSVQRNNALSQVGVKWCRDQIEEKLKQLK